MTHPASAPAAAIPWQRGVAWLLFLGPFFFISYGFANNMAARWQVSEAHVHDWERQIPSSPGPSCPIGPSTCSTACPSLLCRSVQQVDRHALRLLTAQLLSVACFLAFLLTFSFCPPGHRRAVLAACSTPSPALTSLQPGALAPHQPARHHHGCALPAPAGAWRASSSTSGPRSSQRRCSPPTSIISHRPPTGALVGLLCLWLWPDERPAALADARSRHRPSAGAWPCSTASPASAASRWASASAALAVAVLAWLATALVALNYAFIGAEGFQKHAGRHSLASTALLLPTPWRRGSTPGWTRRSPQPDEVADGSGSAARPTQPPCGPAASAASSTSPPNCPPRGPWPMPACPGLDLIAPTPTSLDAAARHDRPAAARRPRAGRLRAGLLAQRQRGGRVADRSGAARWTRPWRSFSGRGRGSCSARPTAGPRQPQPRSGDQRWRLTPVARRPPPPRRRQPWPRRSLDRLSQGLLLLALAALLVPGLGATACGLLLASLIPAGVQATTPSAAA